jgi:hypothetical protein
MSLMSAIRAATRGTGKTRLEDEKPEDMDDDVTEEGEEASEEDEASSDEDETDAEGEEDETEGEDEGDEDTSLSARDRRLILGEQRRIAAILSHPGADANPQLAAKLAFSADHRMTAKKACDLLASGGKSKGSLADRMKGRSPKIGAGSGGRQPNERQMLVAGVRDTIQAMHGRKKEG